MKLRKLVQDIQFQSIKGSLDLEITGLCNHSKLIGPGQLFIAKKGHVQDGSQYIEEAVNSGATAVLTDLGNPFLKGIVQLIHPRVKEIEPLLAARYYDFPSKELFVVAVTGTNGKTTTSYLIRHLLEKSGILCGLIGTIEYIVGAHHFEADRTTPDAITSQKLFKEMLKQGCQAAVMEVTSHALAQKRCEEIDFDVAIFTNLSQDHLDYHLTMERYANEKAKLFKSLDSTKIAIVNAESEWSDKMIRECRARVLTYGFSSQAELYADAIHLSDHNSKFDVHYQGKKVSITSNLVGRYNILNVLCAMATGLVGGIAFEQLASCFEGFQLVPGRLQKVDNLLNLNIYVDYAHTPDALEKVLTCLREIKGGRLITVFGCGGDRDRGKRTQMAAVAEKGSDFTIVTSDNPRSEDPLSICQQVAAGFSSTRNFTLIVDRKEAIERAIEIATPKDLILIAGKGHETYQHFSHQSLPFDDRKIAQEIANRI